MNLLVMFMLSSLASAAPKLAHIGKEKNEYSVPESQSQDLLSQLKTLITEESPEAALYSEEEIKAYFGNSDDSAPVVSNSIMKTQHGPRHGNFAREDNLGAGASIGHVSAPAAADDMLESGRYNQRFETSSLESSRGEESGVWEAGNPILADQGQNSEDPADAQAPEPAGLASGNKITISIDAVRIRNKDEKDSLSSHVNDQHDNAVEYSRPWANPRHNGYFRGRTRPSSPSAESLALLTQKLAKMEVEMGRLKEAVLLQGAVHIKTSERIEMMLLAQGKLAVKNDLDTRKVLKRVRRCCVCSLEGKARRALRRRRKGRTRVKSGEANNSTKTSDSKQTMSNGYSDQNSNAQSSNRENRGRSKDVLELDRSQSDSHSQGNRNSFQNQTANRIIGEQADPKHTEAAKPEENIVAKGSSEKQNQVSEEHPNPKSDVLGPAATTAPHMSAANKTTTIISTTLSDGLSEDKHVNKNNVNKNSAKYSSPYSMSDSDSYYDISTLPQQVSNDTDTPHNKAYYFVNTTSSSKATEDKNSIHSSPNSNGNSSNITEKAINDTSSMNKYNHKHGHETSTKPDDVYHISSTHSDVHVHLKVEPSSISPPLSRKQTTTAKSENSLDKLTRVGDRSEVTEAEETTKEQFSDAKLQSSETPYTRDQPVTSTAVFDKTTKTTTPTPSTPLVSSSLSDALSETSSHRGNENMATSAKDFDNEISSTTMGPADHRDVEMIHQTTTPPVTSTVSVKSSASSTTHSTPTTTTSRLTSSSTHPTTNTATLYKTQTTVKSPTSLATSAELPDTAISMTKTMAPAAATTTTAKMPSTRRTSTGAVTEMTAETTPTTSTPTTHGEEEDPELAVDLSTGEIRNDDLPGVTWVVHPSSSLLSSSGRSFPARWKRSAALPPGPGGKPCVIQGVLKFTFTPPPPSSSSRRGHRHSSGGDDDGEGGRESGRRRLQLEMAFHRPHRWVFNLGDSIANNGFSGDGAVQENDCEAQGYGDTFAVFASDKFPNGRQKRLKHFDNFVREKVTLVVGDQSLEWDNHRGNADHLTDPSLFALAGQSDRQGPVNYDVYLGLNRVIGGHYRRGHGLCRVSARWVKE